VDIVIIVLLKRNGNDDNNNTLSEKKQCHFYFCNNFGKCWLILTMLSLLYSQIYCWGRWY